MLAELGPDVPLHFTAFHPDYRMLDVPPTSPETCRRARDRAKQLGLNHVYSGNIHDAAGQSTYCARCGETLIERDWYELGRYALDGNRCRKCGAELPGHFDSAPPETRWGRKRLRLTVS
jgi:pyruvate formate lyase activating enzyme